MSGADADKRDAELAAKLAAKYGTAQALVALADPAPGQLVRYWEAGHFFVIVVLRETAMHTGCPLYLVACDSCSVLAHIATTSWQAQAGNHVRDEAERAAARAKHATTIERLEKLYPGPNRWEVVEMPNKVPAGRATSIATPMTMTMTARLEAIGADRIEDLALRLISPGPKASQLSASECHELADGVMELLAFARKAGDS